MRTFKSFPSNTNCVVCGTKDDSECILIAIDGTEDGKNCQATPIHTSCLNKLKYNKELNLIYIKLEPSDAEKALCEAEHIYDRITDR